ncbi:Hsp20/alpha crystallin family protein [Coxiella burnetii]|uniref:Small heat shock protein n=2 Tax=Coxiella burnetii TaxID=777 RepID=Q83CE9_COXBU|nr:Hsp20/alpha crystallin family protein [Coxiella burnetii]NP_820166.1 small heat shock protein [Coxiella burnetii RSA 493]AAO90680.1 small heat shock protein [Coxiella burnetii RSA 493]ABS78427.1 small heat shock protein [Coxiella burnetii Dugway 5J108-111]ABX77276.1 Hsp20/alpha crystallin family protein [Coxiella burnetii RSA 331]ACJ18232.1 small heat shock protein [Coxiella burnetii CbuG_Q212]ACJ20238.1 small heat shock protein [Coxiella burnetii CbuK_Q154]
MAKAVQKYPHSMLSHLQQDINRLFEPFGWATGGELWDAFSSEWSPHIDIKDEGQNYLICADIPGVDPKKIQVSMENNILTIKGERETEAKEKSEGYLRIERTKGAFLRQFTLPESVDAESIKAKSKHGVLEITIPKAQPPRTKKIEIEEQE